MSDRSKSHSLLEELEFQPGYCGLPIFVAPLREITQLYFIEINDLKIT